MRAFVITGPGQAEVHDIDPPEPGPGQVVVNVERAGVCGTDREFFTGHMAYLHTGEAHYPVRIGHEWCGVVARAGDESPRPGSGAASPGTRCSAAAGARAVSAADSTYVRNASRSVSGAAGPVLSPSSCWCRPVPCTPS